MPRDSNGNATITRQIAVSGQTVLAEQVNTPFADTQAMLNLVFWRDGIAPATGNFNLNSFKITGLASGSASGDAVNFGQLSGYLSQAGGTMSNGIGFGSAYAATAPTLTRHIALYGTSYGFSVTENSLNYVSFSAHSFYSGTTLVASIDSAGNLKSGSSTFGTDGNATGSIWNAWGSTSAFAAISARIESRSFQRAKEFTATVAAGDIGTYALLKRVTAGNLNPGDVVSGTELEWTNTAAANTGLNVGPGIWRCMGFCVGGGSAASATLFKRES